jgi:hypothetical protein
MLSILRIVAEKPSTKTIFSTRFASTIEVMYHGASVKAHPMNDFRKMSLETPDFTSKTPHHIVHWYKDYGCIMNGTNGDFKYGMRFLEDGKTKCVHSDGSSYEISGMRKFLENNHFT